MIEYTNNLKNINEEMLTGFFVGWPNPPSQSAHMKILEGSYCVWLAIDTETNKVIGFVNFTQPRQTELRITGDGR
ncbi:MAG: hypothetical protein FWG36_00360 [Oscillospiraceae bacterium]|nr:hypothetical protein [Oscillospiraceae bacterium]